MDGQDKLRSLAIETIEYAERSVARPAQAQSSDDESFNLPLTLSYPAGDNWTEQVIQQIRELDRAVKGYLSDPSDHHALKRAVLERVAAIRTNLGIE